MNRPGPISVFSDQHRTKSTTRSRTSCGTHTLVRAPQDFFLKRCARPSARPTPRLLAGSSSPETRSVSVRLDGPGGSGPERQQRHSRRALFANDRIPLAAVPVHHTDRKPALYPTSAASGWQPSLLRCSVFALFSCVLSVILTEERPLQFQLRQDTHSDALHVVERIRRMDHDHLVDEITVDDPKAYTSIITTKRVFDFEPDWNIAEFVCEDSDVFRNYQKKAGAEKK